MKISPITNSSCNISAKGAVSNKVEGLTNYYYQTFSRNYNLVTKKPDKFHYLPIIFSIMGLNSLKFSDSIFKNMKTIMSRFGRTCELTYEVSEKDPSKHLFMISSSNSDHVETIGILKLNKENYDEDFRALNDFTNNELAMLDPYEVNLKFRTMRHENMAGNSSFAPERKIWFIEDELTKLDLSNINESAGMSKDCNPTIGEVMNELNTFKKEFNKDRVLFRRF